jgi:hypothetical protein
MFQRATNENRMTLTFNEELFGLIATRFRRIIKGVLRTRGTTYLLSTY